jgi:hypothetical protein
VVNLVPKELHGPLAAALWREAESARQRLVGVHVGSVSIARSMRLTLVVGMVLAIAAAWGLPALACALAG